MQTGSAVTSDVGRDALGELPHQVDLRVVLEEREVAPRHELEGHPRPLPDVEQGLDELVGVPAYVALPFSSASSGRSNGGGDGGGSGRVAEASMSEYFHCIAHSASR